MQGTPAHIEYIRPKYNKRRNKKKCKHYDDGICKCYKAGVFMCKCNSPTFCGYYVEKEDCNDKESKKLKSTKKNKGMSTKRSHRKLARNKIYINCSVELYDYENKENISIILVEPGKADFMYNKISIKAPLGCELLGKDKNDIIEIETDKIHKYKIISWKKGM